MFLAAECKLCLYILERNIGMKLLKGFDSAIQRLPDRGKGLHKKKQVTVVLVKLLVVRRQCVVMEENQLMRQNDCARIWM